MTPEERALIDGLFDRMRGLEGQPRDREAEALIAQRVAELPHATYALAQTVLVQEHALTQASARIQELEEQARQPAPQQETSFLGGLFGGGRSTSVPSTGGRPAAGGPMGLPQQVNSGAQPNPGAPWGQQGYAQQQGGYPQQGGPWGGQQRGFGGGFGGGGGGFLQGALATAAGVAGGALLFDGIKSLMSSGTGPVAEQAAALETPKETPASGDLGADAQNALGGDPGAATADDGGWNVADAQDAGYDDSGDWGGGDSSDDSWA